MQVVSTARKLADPHQNAYGNTKVCASWDINVGKTNLQIITEKETFLIITFREEFNCF